ncbi:MAG: helix-turn-helix domain-containing protein [Actinomycetota bacterium]|nr:helix-turn-helix domain-containing protein [Actinomycetota bacterium]
MVDRSPGEIMTTKQLAEYLQMSEITICRLARDKKLPGIKIGKEWRFKREVIDDLMENCALSQSFGEG